MKIIFFGTSSFAIPCLSALQRSKETLLAVVTQPDRPGGRGHEALVSPVKRWALERDIAILQPSDLSGSSFVAALKERHPDLFILVSYGRILPRALLTLPSHPAINVHPSLLPRYRGANPVPWAILNGDQKTGVSIIRMVEEVDAGDLLLQKDVAIGRNENALQLSERLSRLGGELLTEALRRIQEGDAVFVPQKGEVRYAPRFRKQDGLIDWRRSAETLSCHIRALVPWPGSYSFFRGKRVILWRAVAEGGDAGGRPGEVVAVSGNGTFRVATGKGKLLLQELQLEGKERMQAKSFLIGHPVRLGETFSCNP